MHEEEEDFNEFKLQYEQLYDEQRVAASNDDDTNQTGEPPNNEKKDRKEN